MKLPYLNGYIIHENKFMSAILSEGKGERRGGGIILCMLYDKIPDFTDIQII